MTNNEGFAKIPFNNADRITLVFEFCPEKISVFDLDKEHNYFEFRFEPWIAEYSFDNFHLTIDGKDLIGKHPLLDEKEYHFEKSK